MLHKRIISEIQDEKFTNNDVRRKSSGKNEYCEKNDE